MSKTAAPLKGIFDEVKAQAANAVMQPMNAPQPAIPQKSERPAPTRMVARYRKAGSRGVRVSGYLPPEIDEALRDEVIKRTVAERRTISFNDVLCSALEDWVAQRKSAQ